VQFDSGQSLAIIAGSDSSDRSKDKSDQKVMYIQLFTWIICVLIQEGIHDLLLDCTLQTLRRLAQNREAARKSRLRKKVWANILSVLFCCCSFYR
jgi:hypothetical protein